jgi:hypothetical protein
MNVTNRKAVTINIKLVAGQTEYNFPDKTILNNRALWQGVYCREPGGSRKTNTGADLVNENCFRAAHLTLVSDVTNEEYRDIPLELCHYEDEGIRGLYVGGRCFDLANSSLKISDPSTITVGEEIEIVIFYDPPNRY